MNETKEEVIRKMLDAIGRQPADQSKRILVGSKSCQGWAAVGYPNLRIALEYAYSLAIVPNLDKDAVESGRADVFVYNIDLDQLCKIQKIA